MPARSNKSILAGYQGELARSKKWRSTEDYDGLWARLVDLYRGLHYSKKSSKDRAVINLAFATINVIGPSVAVNNPRITCNARRPDAAPQSLFAEEVVNYDWRTHRFQSEVRRAVKDWLILGHGWIKAGYKFVQEPVVKKAPDVEEPENDEDEGVDDRVPVEGNVESELHITQNRPFLERVSPHDMFVDPDCVTLETARWVAQRVTRPVADVQVDSRYQASTRSKVTGNRASKLDEPHHPKNRNSSNNAEAPLNYVDVWEYYDLRKRVVCVFADGCDEGFLIKPKPIPFAFGHPFMMLRNYDVPDFFYPMGELEAIEDLQHELNDVRTRMMEQRRKYRSKYLYDKDAFTGTALSSLESQSDDEMVPVQNGRSLDEVLRPVQTMITPAEFFTGANMVQDDIRQVTAVSDYMSGQLPDIRRTATEASLIQDQAQSRAADKLAQLELFIAGCAERVIMLRQQFMTGEEMVRVVGSEATDQPIWLNIDRDYIAGQFDFEVEAGSTQPRNETFRRQSASQLVDAMAPFTEFVNVPALMAKVLQDGFGVKDPSRFIMAPEPDPMAADPMAAEQPMGPQVPEEGFAPQPLPPQGDPSQLAGLMAMAP